MVWYEHMVLGKGCQSRERMIRYRISHHKAHTSVWLVVLPRFPHMVLEILPSAILIQEHYPVDDLTVIGMALTRKEAIRIASELIGESFKTRHDADIAAYLEQIRNREMSEA